MGFVIHREWLGQNTSVGVSPETFLLLLLQEDLAFPKLHIVCEAAILQEAT
jgi:hypothetical protein